MLRQNLRLAVFLGVPAIGAFVVVALLWNSQATRTSPAAALSVSRAAEPKWSIGYRLFDRYVLELQLEDVNTKAELWSIAKTVPVPEGRAIVVLPLTDDLHDKVYSVVRQKWTIWDRDRGFQVVDLPNVATVIENGILLPEFYLVSAAAVADSPSSIPFQALHLEPRLVVARETDETAPSVSMRVAGPEFMFSATDTNSQNRVTYDELLNLSAVSEYRKREAAISQIEPKIYGNSVDVRLADHIERVWAINYEWPTGAVGALLAVIAVGPQMIFRRQHFYNTSNHLNGERYGDFYHLLLIAAFDLDGDLFDELLIRKSYQEGHAYEVLSMGNANLITRFESSYKGAH